MFAQPPDQPLGNHRAQGRGQQKRLDLHVAHPRDRADRIVGVHRRKHQMAGQTRLYRDFGGLPVPDLADHHDVGILPENGA